MDPVATTINSYDKQAKWHSTKFNAYSWDKYLKIFVSLLNGKKVLDFGCGDGRDLENLSKYDLDLTGIDYSKEMVKLARKNSNSKIIKMNFLKKLKFKDKQFSGVWACASFVHVPKRSLGRVLVELNRILAKKGILFVSVKEGHGEGLIKDDYGDFKRFYSFFKKSELVKEIKNKGFSLVHAYTIVDKSLRVKSTKKKKKMAWIALYFIKK